MLKITHLAAAIDARVRAITAGLSLSELRAILRGDKPSERPNPRYRAHVISFLLHIRPRTYPLASTWFTHTFRLGFFATFLFVIEVLTGVVLMIYYVPTPDQAYASIVRLITRVPFGELLRDIHRLAGEGLVACAFLHMARTYITASYKGVRSFTWLTGVALLMITLGLAFSGYLLPWDQLAYWAVTIGTSMAAAAPWIGEELNLLLRGAPDIGADGLLRFYQLHVIVLPLAALLLLGVHYYKVARGHGLSLPAHIEEGDISPAARAQATRRIDFIPDLLTHEIFLASLGGLALLALAIFIYDAPLERHANPQRTPLETAAPWFFLWVQGLLKLGDKAWMGIGVPLAALVLLAALPYLDRNRSRLARRRPLALMLGAIGLISLIILTYLGAPGYGVHLPPAVAIAQALAPEEGVGPLRAVPFDELPLGVFAAEGTNEAALPASFAAVLGDLRQRLAEADRRKTLPQARGLLIVEEWQADLKRVTLRITWATGSPADGEASERQAYTRILYIHRQRSHYK